MELTGTITLDDKTMKELKEQVREKVIQDIKEDGHYTPEIEKFMFACNMKDYINLIAVTIDTVIANTNKDKLYFSADIATWKKLMAIKAVLDM